MGHCALCNAYAASGQRYRLAECAQRRDGCDPVFHRACLARYVAAQLAVNMACEVGCPSCGKQMSVHDVTALSKHAAQQQQRDAQGPPTRPGAKRPRAGGYTSTAPPLAAFATAGSASATKRLLKELRAIRQAAVEGLDVSVPDESNLYRWVCELHSFERGTPLATDLARVAGQRIVLDVSFPSAYPEAPPYVRVLRPRFVYRTGHVTIGGSICTEMLTSAGWLSTMSMESVLLSIRANMVSGGARLDRHARGDYGEAEAREAFERMKRDHGW